MIYYYNYDNYDNYDNYNKDSNNNNNNNDNILTFNYLFTIILYYISNKYIQNYGMIIVIL